MPSWADLLKKISQNSKFLQHQQLPPRLLQTIFWIVVVGNKKGDVKIVFPLDLLFLSSLARRWAEQEPRISILVPAVPVSELLAKKPGKFVNLWIDFREDIFPVYFYSESESYSLKSIQRITNSLAFSCQKLRYRHCRNRNRNSWFLLCSPPNWKSKNWCWRSILGA